MEAGDKLCVWPSSTLQQHVSSYLKVYFRNICFIAEHVHQLCNLRCHKSVTNLCDLQLRYDDILP